MARTTKEPLTAPIKIMISPEEKDKFFDKCAENSTTPSLLIRKWINEYINNKKMPL